MNTSVANYALAISSASYDLYAFTETWLTTATLSSQIFGPEYEVFRGDRTAYNSCKESGGGVLLAVRTHLKPRQLFPPNCTVPEQIWVAVPLASSTLFVCVIYIPPKFDNEKPLFDQHRHSLTWIVSKMNFNDSIMIIGDFNFPAIRWTRTPTNKLFPNLALTPTNKLKYDLLDDYSTANLIQLNDLCNNSNNVLDLCFTSSDGPISYTLLPAPLPLVKDVRHHLPFLVSISCTTFTFRNITSQSFLDYRNGNYDGMNAFLTNINWNLLLTNLDANTAADTWTSIMSHAINIFIPRKQRQPPKHPPWSTHRLQNLKSRKRAALRKYAKHPTDRWKNRYGARNRKYSILNKQLFLRHQNHIQSRLKRDPKQFWNHVNEQRKETGLPTAMILDDEEATTTESICDLFRRQFSSVFTDETLEEAQIARAASNVPLRPPIGPHPTISPESIRRACVTMKGSISSGPDGIPALVLKKCCEALAEPLAQLFNTSLTTGVFPSCWKKSFVFPVHKKGSKRDIRNYRGIAALCAVSKLFEVIVLDFIKFNCCDYIAQEQHGFMAKRSTCSNLVTYSSFLLRTMQQRKQIDALYTDLSAAFDKLNHRIAVAKFERLGFNGSLLSWIRSYLTGREMCVKVGDVISAIFAVFSGVPQGSHLGPLLYLLYMNDVHLLLDCNKLSYADDIKLYTVIEKVNDCQFLQTQLQRFANWCTENRMVLNASKCSVITFTRKHNVISYDYTLSNTSIPRTSCVKDLGVVLDSKMSFSDHITHIVSKASKTLGFIFRIAKNFHNISCLKALYCALVRSTLEYCSTVWAPFYQNGIQRLESVQRKFVKYVQRHMSWPDPANPPSYLERCKMLNLDTLSVRRDVAKATFVADLLQSSIDCPAVLQLININTRQRVLRNHSFLTVRRALTNYGRNEPVSSMCRVFNSCSDLFDFDLSRNTLKVRFLNFLNSLP